MITTLSTKGQVVLPRSARSRLGLKPGDVFMCRIEGGEIILKPKVPATIPTRLVRDEATGLVVTEAPPDSMVVTSEQVKALLSDFP